MSFKDLFFTGPARPPPVSFSDGPPKFFEMLELYGYPNPIGEVEEIRPGSPCLPHFPQKNV